MDQEKIVKRSKATLFAAICITLVIGVAIESAYIINAISSLDTQISSLKSQISEYYAQNSDLQSQVSDLNDIIDLEKAEIWLNITTFTQQAGSYTSWNFSAPYSGIITVLADSSAGHNSYVRVIWNSRGVAYDNQIDEQVTAHLWGCAFPVLPSSNVEIRLGNTNLIDNAWGHVGITYRY